MTERELADLLRLIDDQVAPDAAEIEFKTRLRADLDETLDRDGVNKARLQFLVGSPRRKPTASIVAAAALIVVVAGALMLGVRPTSDAPASPISTLPTASTTTLPVLEVQAACERFRASNADELLASAVPDTFTVAELNDAVDAIEVLLADVDATHPDDPIRTVVLHARNAMREAALRLQDDDRAGALAALRAAQIETGAPVDTTRFAACFER